MLYWLLALSYSYYAFISVLSDDIFTFSISFCYDYFYYLVSYSSFFILISFTSMFSIFFIALSYSSSLLFNSAYVFHLFICWLRYLGSCFFIYDFIEFYILFVLVIEFWSLCLKGSTVMAFVIYLNFFLSLWRAL